MAWLRQNYIPVSLDDISDIVVYPVKSNPENNLVVARAILDLADIPGIPQH